MKIRFVIIILLFVISGCKKSNHGISSGNYFIATVNGSLFNAGGAQSFTAYMSATISSSNHLLILDGADDHQDISLGVYDSSGIKNKTYSFITPHTIPYTNSAEYRNYSKDISHGYITDATHTGTLTINIDTLHMRISGKFDFLAKFEINNDTVNVINGSFSLPLNIGM